MEKPMNVCVLVGSLRKASINGMLANALMSLAPSSMKLEIVEIGQLPFYNQDLEINPPPAPWTAFRQRVMATDAVLFVTSALAAAMPAKLPPTIKTRFLSGTAFVTGGFSCGNDLVRTVVMDAPTVSRGQ